MMRWFLFKGQEGGGRIDGEGEGVQRARSEMDDGLIPLTLLIIVWFIFTVLCEPSMKNFQVAAEDGLLSIMPAWKSPCLSVSTLT